MGVFEQIEDAEYFLYCIKNSYSHKAMRANSGAFLTASRSIADHLLQEYNIKCGLNIKLDVKLTYDRFENEAKKLSNQNALLFLRFYKRRFEDLKQNPIFKTLLDKRNIKIHRTDISVHKESHVKIYETVTVSDSVSVVVYDNNGNVKQRSISQQQNKQEGTNIPQQPTQSEVKWYLADFDKKELPEVCQEFLDIMKGFVYEIRLNFP